MHLSLPIRLLLVIALLFSQLGGLSHGIAHAMEEQSRDQSLPHDRLCDLCASYAQLGTAFASTALPFPPVVQRSENAFPVCFAFFSTVFPAFAARAPPCSA